MTANKNQGGYTVIYRSEYFSYCQMKSRCLNVKHIQFSNYGGRGIKVCDRWINYFVDFINDMGAKPAKGYSIDRIDVNGNYQFGNCRWATNEQQCNNTRKTVYLEYNGERLSITQWARKIGVNKQTLHERYKRGYSATQIIEKSTLDTKHILKRKYKNHEKVN